MDSVTTSSSAPSLAVTEEQVYSGLKDEYEACKRYVSNAYVAEEEENFPFAIEQYTHALQCLEKIEKVQVNRLHDEKLASAQQMQSEMLPILHQVQSKLYDLIETSPVTPTAPEYSILSDEQPNYSIPAVSDAEFEAAENSQSLGVPNEPEIVAEECVSPQDARILLHIPGGVQLFVVEQDMQVSAAPPSYPTSLKVFAFDDDEEESLQQSRPPAFIQVGEWVYPLVHDQTPVLLCSNGAFMFPIFSAQDDDPQQLCVGIVISSALDPSYTEMFTNILASMACLQIQEERLQGEPNLNLRDSIYYEPDIEEASTSDKIASGIETGASWLSWGFNKSAQLTSSLIKKGTDRLQKYITPNETPTSVNPTLRKGLYYTHAASKVTVKVSGVMIDGLKFVSGEIAKTVAPHVTSYTKSLLSSSSSNSSSNESGHSSSSSMKGVMKVAGAGLQGFGTVWTGLEKAGMAIACSISEATVDTIQHKYGEEMGQSTSHVMGAAINYGRTVFNIDNIGIKAIVKRTAKDTGKAMIKDFYPVEKSPQ